MTDDRGAGAAPSDLTAGDTFIVCILCGLQFARRFSADISQCYRCHWLLNRLALIPPEEARIAWKHYRFAVDFVRGVDEPAPVNWHRPLFGTEAEPTPSAGAPGLVEALREITNAFHLTLDHSCPPPPNACHRCVVLANARAALAAADTGTGNNIQRAVVEEREACARIADEESEAPGPIPLNLVVLCLTPDGATAVVRAAIRATKSGIASAIRQRAPAPEAHAHR
jgi:hypothetical protein